MNDRGHDLERRLFSESEGFRSRGESRLAALLDHWGIRYEYERPTRVIDRWGRRRIWRPDFTLPDYGDLIVEYAGMPDRPDYMRGVRYKQRAYAANGLPSVFIYPAQLYSADWSRRVLDTIETTACHEVPAHARGYDTSSHDSSSMRR